MRFYFLPKVPSRPTSQKSVFWGLRVDQSESRNTDIITILPLSTLRRGLHARDAEAVLKVPCAQRPHPLIPGSSLRNTGTKGGAKQVLFNDFHSWGLLAELLPPPPNLQDKMKQVGVLGYPCQKHAGHGCVQTRLGAEGLLLEILQ